MENSEKTTTIGILGGTGKEGKGLAYRWLKAGHPILIGSRQPEKAEAAAAELLALAGGSGHARGAANTEVAQQADILVLTVPYAAHRDTLETLKPHLAGKILVDVTVPLVPPRVTRVQMPPAGSAAQPLTIAVDYDSARLKTDDLLACTVKVAWTGAGAAEMAIVDLGVPPGFEVQTADFDALRQRDVIERYALTGRQVILYFRRLAAGQPVSFAYHLRAKYPVKAQAPPAAAYLYYQPELRAQTAPALLTVE